MITNPISGPVEEVDLKTFLSNFDHSVHADIEANLARFGVTGVMMYENLQMDSSAFGRRTAMIFGPSCTYKSAEHAAQGWLNDLPSQRQYPRVYYRNRRSFSTRADGELVEDIGPIHEGFAK